MKVRIKKGPNKRPGMSSGFNASKFPYYYPSGEWTPPETDVRSSIQPAEPGEGNVEAEGGESVFVPDVGGGNPAHFDITGPRHSSGGVKLDVPKDSFFFSDTRDIKIGGDVLKHFGKPEDTKKKYTPADLAKKYDINKFLKQAADPNSTDLQKKTAQMMIENYEKKLGQLALVQEAKKGFPNGVPQMAQPYLQSIGAGQPDEQEQQSSNEQGEQGMRDGGFIGYGNNSEPETFYSTNPFQNSPTGGGFWQDGGSWEGSSNSNDPAKGYWNRAAMANFFRRQDSNDIDPRMNQAVDKLVHPSHSQGVGDYARNLFSIPQNELNHLVSGYYEPFMNTENRYNAKKMSPATEFVGNVATDPMMWPEIPYALGKGTVEGAIKYGPPVARSVGKATVKAGKYAGEKAMQAGKYIAEHLPDLGRYAPTIASRIGQAAIHAPGPVPGPIPYPNPNSPIAMDPSIPPAWFQAPPQYTQPSGPEIQPYTQPYNLDLSKYSDTELNAIEKTLPKKQDGGVITQDDIAAERERRKKSGSKAPVRTDSQGRYEQFSKPWYDEVRKLGYDPNITDANYKDYPADLPPMQAHTKTGVYGEKDWWKNPVLRQGWENRHQWYMKDHPNFDPTDKTQVKDFQEKHNEYLSKMGLPTYFNTKWDKAHATDGLFGAVTASAPDPTQISHPEQVAQAVKQAGAIQPIQAKGYKRSEEAPWWLQDVVGTAGAAYDYLNLKKYLPWGAKATPYIPEPTFFDPTRALANNTEQMNIGTQGINAYSGPQQFNSRFSQIQGQGAKNAADTIANYDERNVGLSNQFSGMRSDILNKADEFNANQATSLYDKNTIANQQFDNSKREALTNLRDQYTNAITNRADAQRYNQLYPHFNISPSTGGMGNFTGNPYPEMTPSYGNDKVKSMAEYLSTNQGIAPKDAWELAIKYHNPADEANDYRNQQLEEGEYPPMRRRSYR